MLIYYRTPHRIPLKSCIPAFTSFRISRPAPPSRVATSYPFSPMPSAFTGRPFSPVYSPFDTTMNDATQHYDGTHFVSPETEQMLFGDMDDVSYSHEQSMIPFPWDPESELEMKPAFTYGLSSTFDIPPQPSPTESFFDSSGFYTPEDSNYSPFFNNDLSLSNNDLSLAWVNDSERNASTSPIPIPSSPVDPQFVSYHGPSHFPEEGAFSPVTLAALHPLPESISPSSSFEDRFPATRQRVDSISSISPMDTSLVPEWASQLWEKSQPTQPTLSPRSVSRPSPLSDSTARPRLFARRGSVGQIFQSSSAPSFSPLSGPGPIRSYSHRAESSDDRDATVRRKRKTSVPDDIQSSDKATDCPPLKPVLRPPKLAPSAWQLYFTDWIQRQQASNTRKLNVAQAAKEAGQEYASLSSEEKEPYKRRSQALKEARERELNAYMSSLTPEDIKRENAYRTAQRKAGKSRKSNIKDPNAPKKPLSAYFMFLQRIRANPQMVQEIFGDETETTKQSVLAAAKWRSMTDDERKPYLAQAEHEKMEYEAARRLYEEGTTGFGTSINFSILPGSPLFPTIKVESESESEGLPIDGFNRRP